VPTITEPGRDFSTPTPTARAHSSTPSRRPGWTFGGPHSGHLVGEFLHELIDGEREIGGFFEQLLTVRRPGALP